MQTTGLLTACLALAPTSAFVGSPLCRSTASSWRNGQLTMFGDEKPPGSQVRVEKTPPPRLTRGRALDSPYACEVNYGDGGSILSRRAPLCWSADLTTSVALDIVEEAAANMTVPAATLGEALNLLRYKEEEELRRGAGGTAVQELAGFWSLCFRSGAVLADMAVDAQGYLTKDDHVDLRLNVRKRNVALDSNIGLMRSTVTGEFSYAPAGDALEARFDQLKMGPLTMRSGLAALVNDMCRVPLRMRIFLATDKALAVVTSFAGKSGVMLFRRVPALTSDMSRSELNARKHAQKILGLARFDHSLQHGATTEEALASSRSPDEEGFSNGEEGQGVGNGISSSGFDARAEEEEAARRKADAWKSAGLPPSGGLGQYLSEESHKIFFVVAGPTLLSFCKLYLPIALWKAGTAAAVIQDVLERNV